MARIGESGAAISCWNFATDFSTPPFLSAPKTAGDSESPSVRFIGFAFSLPAYTKTQFESSVLSGYNSFVQLTFTDWFVVALYFLFNLGIGLYYKSRAGTS